MSLPEIYKSFEGALGAFLAEQCPQIGGSMTRQVLVQGISNMVSKFYPETSLCILDFSWKRQTICILSRSIGTGRSSSRLRNWNTTVRACLQHGNSVLESSVFKD